MEKTPGMNGREIDFIPDRLIEEPVVFRGMTDTEVVTIIVLAILFWIPICAAILSFFDRAVFGVGGGFGLAIVTLIVVGKYLQGLKRRMPDGLHIVYLKKKLQKKVSFVNFGYIEETMRWDIRRDTVVEKKITKSVDEED